MRRRFRYWVVRYVPDPVREEFVNVAVVASDGSDRAVVTTSSVLRADSLVMNPHVARRAIGTKVAELQHEIPTDAQLDAMSINNHGIYQVTRARPAMAASADKAATQVARLLIV